MPPNKQLDRTVNRGGRVVLALSGVLGCAESRQRTAGQRGR